VPISELEPILPIEAPYELGFRELADLFGPAGELKEERRKLLDIRTLSPSPFPNIHLGIRKCEFNVE
jgi:hypothetical protein